MSTSPIVTASSGWIRNHWNWISGAGTYWVYWLNGNVFGSRMNPMTMFCTGWGRTPLNGPKGVYAMTETPGCASA